MTEQGEDKEDTRYQLGGAVIWQIVIRRWTSVCLFICALRYKALDVLLGCDFMIPWVCLFVCLFVFYVFSTELAFCNFCHDMLYRKETPPATGIFGLWDWHI